MNEYLEYSGGLRESGVTNMLEAGHYLEVEFGLSRKEAKDVLLHWMETFAERHPA